jgi:hypothetical protein
MAEPQPNCPFCRERMERGFILDGQHGRLVDAQWYEGAPQRSFWTGIKIKNVKHHPILSFRCPRCGFLANYAASN